MFLAEQKSIPLLDTKNLEKNINWNTNNDNTETFDDNYDLDLIILHRSLYIMKKKFEKYKNEFKEVYNNYKELISGENILEDEILVEQTKVPNILEDIFNVGKFALIHYDNFKEVIQNEMKFFDKIKLDKDIINDFMEFLVNNRQKYNYIFKEKKLNKNFKLEDYVDYIPQGADELTKIVMETETSQKNKKSEKNKDNASEIVTTTNNLEETEKDNLNGEIAENKENESENNDVQLVNKKKLKPKTILKKSPSFHSEYENPKKVQYSKSYLYIESLLLILADFISGKNRNKSYIIIDFGEEYRKELRTLFDNEILGRLGEEVLY